MRSSNGRKGESSSLVSVMAKVPASRSREDGPLNYSKPFKAAMASCRGVSTVRRCGLRFFQRRLFGLAGLDVLGERGLHFRFGGFRIDRFLQRFRVRVGLTTETTGAARRHRPTATTPATAKATEAQSPSGLRRPFVINGSTAFHSVSSVISNCSLVRSIMRFCISAGSKFRCPPFPPAWSPGGRLRCWRLPPSFCAKAWLAPRPTTADSAAAINTWFSFIFILLLCFVLLDSLGKAARLRLCVT